MSSLSYWRGRWKAHGVSFMPPPKEPRRPRKACARGHSDAKYGVTSTEGYRRCRRCLAQNQRRYEHRRRAR